MKNSAALIALVLLSSPATIHAKDTVASSSPAAAVVQEQLNRIQELDSAGPHINSIIALNPNARRDAAAAESAGLPLGGRTVLVKDNIETRELPTTAGSLALKANNTRRDAPLIMQLRAAGGVVLGKTNLSEWANIRSYASTSGWSAIGGQTRNPHATDRNPCGSSSGSGAAVAASFAWAAIGTETDGSVTCPASVNGIVGFKPTVGLVSQRYIVPISHSQDTAGPMARSVRDAAMLLNAIVDRDAQVDEEAEITSKARDTITAALSILEQMIGGKRTTPKEDVAPPLESVETKARSADFTAGFDTASLKGMRIGVLRKQVGNFAPVIALFDAALDDMRKAGAAIVDIDYEEPPEMSRDEFVVLLYELRENLNSYLAASPANIPVRTLADVIAFNKAHQHEEMRFFGQETFEKAEATTDKAAYQAARANSLRLAGEEGIDRMLREYNVSLLIAPTTGPAWPIDLIYGDNYPGSIGAGSLAAVAGYPHLSVPMGAAEGLPVGLSFMGAKWYDHEVLKAGAAYEKVRSAPLPTPAFRPWQPED